MYGGKGGVACIIDSNKIIAPMFHVYQHDTYIKSFDTREAAVYYCYQIDKYWERGYAIIEGLDNPSLIDYTET